MAISNIPTEPGVFSQFKPVTTFPVLPGGFRVAALVGKGRITNLVNGESVTKGIEDAVDALAHTAVSLSATIVDAEGNTYKLGEDYQLTGGAVDWSLSAVASLTGTVGENYDMSAVKTLKLTVGSGLEQSFDISEVGNAGSYAVPASATAAEVAIVIASIFTGVTASDDTGKVKISTVATNNSGLVFGNGDANAVLGFTDGSFVQTPREPVPTLSYSVSYEYAKASADYIPRFMFNMNDVTDEHGDVSTANTLSLGAEIVFQQGASLICVVQTDPADGADVTQFRKAIDKLLPVKGINIVVALSSDQSLFPYLKNHCNTASSITERKERTAIVGMSGSPSVSTLSTQAQALAIKRMVIVSPGSATRFVGSASSASTLSGPFVAAAVAGIRTSRSFDVADPATRKEIIGFETIDDTFLRAEKVTLLSKGVMVIENVSGIYRIMQQVTTDPSTSENKEYSVVETIDFVGQSMRDILETIYIGQKILEGTPSQVRTTVQTILNDLISRELIVSSANVQATLNTIDPTQIDVAFEIAPVWPLNFILISFSLSPNV